ncbi:MAG TPA: tetratricopeptide repeat protein, partial [Ktedonobacteraceae bacterium]|nr:tetratricopeptide repeat protein [Ktedonobacteraceae bacterium]
ASFERAIEMQPQELAPYAELTVIYTKQGQLPRAREILERGLRGNPKSAHLLALLSSVYLQGGDTRRATAVLEEAEQINPKLDIVQAMREELNRRKKK